MWWADGGGGGARGGVASWEDIGSWNEGWVWSRYILHMYEIFKEWVKLEKKISTHLVISVIMPLIVYRKTLAYIFAIAMQFLKDAQKPLRIGEGQKKGRVKSAVSVYLVADVIVQP